MLTYASFIASLMLFGTLGMFVRYIPLPPGDIALARSIIGSLCLMPALIRSAGNWIFVLVLSVFVLGERMTDRPRPGKSFHAARPAGDS